MGNSIQEAYVDIEKEISKIPSVLERDIKYLYVYKDLIKKIEDLKNEGLTLDEIHGELLDDEETGHSIEDEVIDMLYNFVDKVSMRYKRSSGFNIMGNEALIKTITDGEDLRLGIKRNKIGDEVVIIFENLIENLIYKN